MFAVGSAQLDRPSSDLLNYQVGALRSLATSSAKHLDWTSVGDGSAVTDALKVECLNAIAQVRQEGFSCKAMKPLAQFFLALWSSV